MAENLYTEADRRAVRVGRVRTALEHLKKMEDPFYKFQAVKDIQMMWQQVESGSGTNAEALARLAAMGYGDLITEVKEHMHDQDPALMKYFHIKLR